MINIQNTENNYKCFKWCFVRYSHPVDRNPARIRKNYKSFARELDVKDIEYHEKIREIHKIEEKLVSAFVFLVMKIRKNVQSMFQKVLLRNMLIYS